MALARYDLSVAAKREYDSLMGSVWCIAYKREQVGTRDEPETKIVMRNGPHKDYNFFLAECGSIGSLIDSAEQRYHAHFYELALSHIQKFLEQVIPYCEEAIINYHNEVTAAYRDFVGDDTIVGLQGFETPEGVTNKISIVRQRALRLEKILVQLVSANNPDRFKG